MSLRLKILFGVVYTVSLTVVMLDLFYWRAG